jgi:hypothetical protein
MSEQPDMFETLADDQHWIVGFSRGTWATLEFRRVARMDLAGRYWSRRDALAAIAARSHAWSRSARKAVYVIEVWRAKERERENVEG